MPMGRDTTTPFLRLFPIPRTEVVAVALALALAEVEAEAEAEAEAAHPHPSTYPTPSLIGDELNSPTHLLGFFYIRCSSWRCYPGCGWMDRCAYRKYKGPRGWARENMSWIDEEAEAETKVVVKEVVGRAQAGIIVLREGRKQLAAHLCMLAATVYRDPDLSISQKSLICWKLL